MRIQGVSTLIGSTGGLGEHDFNTNKVDILTGPNGSGKTILLSSIQKFFRSKYKNDRSRIHVSYENPPYSWTAPSPAPRIIAQTFSPFTRFPSPESDHKSILESFSAEPEQVTGEYICAGIHRGTRSIGINLSKSVLENSIFRLSQSSRYADALSQAFSMLKFSSILSFIYTPKKNLSSIYNARNRQTAIHDLIIETRNLTRAGQRPRTALGLEASISDPNALSGLIESAIEQLDRIRTDGLRFELFFDFNNRRTLDFATLQSLVLLRKLGFLNLKNCFLGGSYDPKSDVSYSSSGQQQLLCSLLSLISSLADGAILLIDEPELSLHPTWQQSYFDILLACIAPFRNCHVIVATHSPLIVQRAQNAGAGIIKMGRNATNEATSADNSSVEDALLDIFETPITDSVEMASQIFDAITQAEEGTSNDRKDALAKIERLRRIYSTGTELASKDLAMINDAYKLITQG